MKIKAIKEITVEVIIDKRTDNNFEEMYLFLKNDNKDFQAIYYSLETNKYNGYVFYLKESQFKDFCNKFNIKNRIKFN